MTCATQQGKPQRGEERGGGGRTTCRAHAALTAAAGTVSLAEAAQRLLPAALSRRLAGRQGARALCLSLSSTQAVAAAATAVATVFVVQILLMISITSSTQLNSTLSKLTSHRPRWPPDGRGRAAGAPVWPGLAAELAAAMWEANGRPAGRTAAGGEGVRRGMERQ